MDDLQLRQADYHLSKLLVTVGTSVFAGWMAQINIISAVAFHIIEKIADSVFTLVFPCDKVWVGRQVRIYDPDATPEVQEGAYEVFKFIVEKIRSLCTTFICGVVLRFASFPEALMTSWQLSFYRILGERALTHISGAR